MRPIPAHRVWLMGVVGLGGIVLNGVLLPKHFAPHVQVETMKPAEMSLIVRASGNLEAKDSNTLRAQFDGPVIQKLFREGQKVVKGQRLAELGRDRIKLDYRIRSDNLKNAETDLEKAKRDLKLQKALFGKQAVAYSTVEDAQRALEKAKQNLRSNQESFRLEQTRWESAVVTAPLSGTIVKDWLGDEKNVNLGKEIVTVADVSEFTVHARVDELDSKQVKEGQTAEIQIQIYPQTIFPAVVTEVGATSDGAASPDIPVVLKMLSHHDLLLRPKLTAEARILTGKTGPVLSVPLTAVANTDGQPKVWVLGWLNRIQARRVELGRGNPDRSEVVQGLKPGDRVLITAEPDYVEGSRVIIGDAPKTFVSRTRVLLEKAKKESRTVTASPFLKGATVRKARRDEIFR